MTPEQAFNAFLSGFGMPACESASTPSDAELPYMTYDLSVSYGFGAGEVNVPVSMWMKTNSEALINGKVRLLWKALKDGGATIPCDGGMLWLKPGSPWSQSVRTDEDNVKCRRMNIDIEYLIAD